MICGNNKKLYDTLSARPRASKVQTVGYTDAMSCYMDAAELLLTKPGGLSCTEAAAKALPMLFFGALSLYERANADVFIKRGGARSVGSISELCSLVREYMDDSERLKNMSKALKSEAVNCAVEKIYDSVVIQA